MIFKLPSTKRLFMLYSINTNHLMVNTRESKIFIEEKDIQTLKKHELHSR